MPIFSLPALLRVLAVWLLIMLVESVSGILRRLLFDPETLFAFRQAFLLLGAVIIFLMAWACGRWMRLRSGSVALAAGLLWAVLTIGFEAAVGRALGYGWDRIWSEYDLRSGGMMALGLIAMALTPWAVRWLGLQRARRASGS